jgi:hypothetical protein
MDYKKQIEKHAVEYLHDLDAGKPPFIIGRTISFFECSLSKKGLLEDDMEVTHSEKLLVPGEWISNIISLAVRIAKVYETKHIELINNKEKKYYFAFVGGKSDVHACYVSLKKLLQIAKDVRQEFIHSRNKRMKPENKENRADEFMDEWIENMGANIRSTALTRDNYDDLNKYIAENFHTTKELEDYELTTINFLKILFESDEKTATVGDIRELYNEKYGDDFNKRAEMFKELVDQDLLIEWPWPYFERYSPYGDKKPDFDDIDEDLDDY